MSGTQTYYIHIPARGRETLGWWEDYGVEFYPAGLTAEMCWAQLPSQFPGMAILALSVVPNGLHAMVRLSGGQDPEVLVEAYREVTAAATRETLWKKKHSVRAVDEDLEIKELRAHLAGLAAGAGAVMH